MLFLFNRWTKQLQTLQVHRSYDEEDTGHRFVFVKVKIEIMYVLVNASPKRLDVATSNFADALVSSKAGICDGLPSTEVWLLLLLHYRQTKITSPTPPFH